MSVEKFAIMLVITISLFVLAIYISWQIEKSARNEEEKEF